MDTEHRNVDSDVYIYITTKTFGIWLDENLGYNTIQYIISAQTLSFLCRLLKTFLYHQSFIDILF